ncbi:REF/SRPP-like protein, partial [Trifolium medium]|nr:REF/SRPP-like protein [Trifolium medium]
MTTTKQSDGNNDHDEELKHLGFVKIAAIQAFVCMSSLYDYAKQNSGPLRSAVCTVE